MSRDRSVVTVRKQLHFLCLTQLNTGIRRKKLKFPTFPASSTCQRVYVEVSTHYIQIQPHKKS